MFFPSLHLNTACPGASLSWFPPSSEQQPARRCNVASCEGTKRQERRQPALTFLPVDNCAILSVNIHIGNEQTCSFSGSSISINCLYTRTATSFSTRKTKISMTPPLRGNYQHFNVYSFSVHVYHLQNGTLRYYIQWMDLHFFPHLSMSKTKHNFYRLCHRSMPQLTYFLFRFILNSSLLFLSYPPSFLLTVTELVAHCPYRQ